eukprot:2801804-Pyramimonas_sp.AAC.1
MTPPLRPLLAQPLFERPAGRQGRPRDRRGRGEKKQGCLARQRAQGCRGARERLPDCQNREERPGRQACPDRQRTRGCKGAK